MRRYSIILTAVAGFAFATPSCLAQTQGLFNTQGASQGGGTAAQGLGQGGLGQGGLGQGGLGQGAGSGIQLNQLGSLGGQIGQNAFVGQGNTGQFVGNEQVGGQGQTGNNPRFNRAEGGQGFQQPENDQGSQRRRIRPRYRIAFEYDSLTTATVTERARQQVVTFQTAFNLPDSISVELDKEGTAILRGQAMSTDMRSLIANLVRLEPGVRDVKNELVVAGDETP